jgi:site-specific recombinase XerD
MKRRSKGADLVFAEYPRVAFLAKAANWFPAIIEAAGIQDFTWHSLRHDFASQLVMRGVDLKTVQTLMCHATIKQTAIYADLAPEYLQSSVERLAAEKPSATKTATSGVELPLSA